MANRRTKGNALLPEAIPPAVALHANAMPVNALPAPVAAALPRREATLPLSAPALHLP